MDTRAGSRKASAFVDGIAACVRNHGHRSWALAAPGAARSWHREIPVRDIHDIMQAVERLLSRERLTLADREDIVQTVMVRLLERLREPDAGVVTNAAFAAGIARNVVREHRRNNQRREVLERYFVADLVDVCGTAAAPLDVAFERAETLDRIATAKRRLSEREQWLIEARFVEDTNYASLLPRFNAAFGRTVRTTEGLRTALFHARARLRVAFEAEHAAS